MTTHDPHAENELIGCLLKEPSLIVDVQGVVQPDDFFHIAERTVYESLLRLQGKVEQDDYVLVEKDIIEHGGSDRVPKEFFLDTFTHTGPAFRAPEHARTVRHYARLRAIVQEYHKLSSVIQERGIITNDDIVEFYQTINRRLMDGADLEKVQSIQDLLKDFSFERTRRIDDPSYPQIGIRDIDKAVDFFERGSLAVWASRPRMGKSSLMRQGAMRIAHHEQVLMFTLEEPAKMMRDKMICFLARVPYRHLVDSMLTAEQQSKMVVAQGELAELRMDLVDGTVGLMDIVTISHRMKAFGRPPRVIFIDHLQQMKHQLQRGETMVNAIARTTKGLQDLAKQLDCAVVLLCQLNRGPEQRGRENQRPMLADLRDSGSVEQDAFSLLFIWSDDPDQNLRNFYVAKNKNGPTCEKEVAFLQDVGVFSDLYQAGV